MVHQSGHSAVVWLVASLFVGTGHAMASEEFTTTLGLKAWSNRWNVWDYLPPMRVPLSNATLAGFTENYSGGRETAMIPSLTLRYGRYLASGSAFVKQGYGLDNGSGDHFRATREESDFRVGYYVLDRNETLTLSLWRKSVEQTFGPKSFKYDGPLLVLAGTAPITLSVANNVNFYGNIGIGAMKVRFPSGYVDNAGRAQLNARYYTGEIGLAYSMDVKAFIPAAKAMTVTLGYRNQTIAIQDFSVGTNIDRPKDSRLTELRDNAEGLVLGMSISF